MLFKQIKRSLFLGMSFLTFSTNAFSAIGNFSEIVGSPFPAGAAPASVAYSPLISGNLFAGIPNYDDNTVSVYEVNQATGAFTEIVGSPFETGGLPAWIAYSPIASGNLFASIVNFNDNTVSVYGVNPTTGAFTEVTGSPFPTGVAPYGVKFSPVVSGNLFAAVTNSGSNTVSVYEVNQVTGAFTEVANSPFVTGSQPYIGSFSSLVSENLFAAIPNYNDNTVSIYEVDQTSGAFTEIVGSPFPTGINPYNVEYSPSADGNLFAAVVNLTTNNVSVYSVNQTTGALSEIATSPFAAGTGANLIAFSPFTAGTLLTAVANFASNNISVYSVDPNTGTFSQVSGSPFASGSEPDGIAFTSLLAGGIFAATANFGSNNASVYQVTFPPSAPEITNVTPPQGSVCGGTLVTIIGTNFTGTTAVNFGNTPATSFTVVSDTMITAIAPGVVAGIVDITVTTPSGTSPLVFADQFAYVSPGVPSKPEHCKGMINEHGCRSSPKFTLKISWKPSSSPAVTLYHVYKGKTIVDTIPATGPLTYKTKIKSGCSAKKYSITAVNCANLESDHAHIKIVGNDYCPSSSSKARLCNFFGRSFQGESNSRTSSIGAR